MQLLLLDARDNIAIATTDLRSGDLAAAAAGAVAIREDIPRGHKVALVPMASGTDVIRYGEIIGATTSYVSTGEHVHVHNLISKRIPGRDT